MIIGIGVDIVEVERFRGVVERWGELFLKRVFTDREINYCLSKKNTYQHLAGRFAAKEAFSKAISTGWSGIFRWKDVEILTNINGKPSVKLYNDLLKKFELCSIHISISHTQNTAVAFVVVERD